MPIELSRLGIHIRDPGALDGTHHGEKDVHHNGHNNGLTDTSATDTGVATGRDTGVAPGGTTV